MNDNGDKLSPPPLRAFTLIEVLVVLAIIALLVAITMPVINRAGRMAKLSACAVTIRMLDSACSLYETDFNALPPCYEPSTFYQWTGGQILAFLLTGYADDHLLGTIPGDPNYDEKDHFAGDLLHEDDGLDGYGFRLVRGGQKYGPYNEAHTIKIRRYNYIDATVPGFIRPEFIDSFGKPILYYTRLLDPAGLTDPDLLLYRREIADPFTNDGFDINPAGPHPNSNDPNDDPNDPNRNIDLFARNADGAYYRSDFMLISLGAADEWRAPKNEGRLNVTNFKVGAQ